MLRFLRIERPTIATLRPTSDRDVDRLLHPVDVRRERDDEDAARAQRDQRAGTPRRRARSGPVIPGRSAFVESPSIRSTPLVAELGEPADVGLEAVDGRVVELPVARCGRPGLPAVSRTTATQSGIECATRTKSRVNGPSRICVAGLRLLQLGRGGRPCSSSFDLIRPSVSLVAITSSQSTSRSRYGSRADVVLVPVREHDRADAAGSREIADVRQDEVDAEVLVAREREARVDDRRSRRRARRRSCSCRPRRGRPVG